MISAMRPPFCRPTPQEPTAARPPVARSVSAAATPRCRARDLHVAQVQRLDCIPDQAPQVTGGDPVAAGGGEATGSGDPPRFPFPLPPRSASLPAPMSDAAPPAPGDFFGPPTLWTQVINQVRDGDPEKAFAALESISERYRDPILRHIQRQQQCGRQDAEDLTQEFLAECLRRELLMDADRSKGRFRAFIKDRISKFLIDKYRFATRKKRGGQYQPASLDETDEDGNALHDPPAEIAEAGLDLDRDWARTLLARSMTQLEQECRQARHVRMFAELKGSLHASEDVVPTANLADQLGMKEGAVKVARHRLRQRLGELIEDEVRQTVAAGQDWREELRELIRLIGR